MKHRGPPGCHSQQHSTRQTVGDTALSFLYISCFYLDTAKRPHLEALLGPMDGKLCMRISVFQSVFFFSIRVVRFDIQSL